MVYEKILFTEEECEQILQIKRETPQLWGHIRGRNYKSESIINNKNNEWIFDRYVNFFEETTNHKLKEINNTIHFHTYKNGDLFGKHNDLRYGRIYIIGTILNVGYEGGYLKVYDDSEVIINKEMGTTFLFNTDLFHEVTEIESGIRYSLIWFIHANELVNKKQRLY